MNAIKTGIIGLAVALAAVIGYVVYLHQGPIKDISSENQSLLAEIDQLNTALKDKNSANQSELDARNRREQELETKNAVLEEAVARISREKELIETELAKAAQENQRLAKQTVAQQGEREQLEHSKLELEKQLAESRSRLQAISDDIAIKDRKLAKAAQENQTLTKKIVAQQGESDQLQQSKIELEKQLAESQSRLQVISDETASKDRKLVEMEKKLQEMLSRIESQENEKEELLRLKDAMRNQLGMTQSQIEALSTDAATKGEQLKSMEKAYRELSRQLEQQIKEKEIQISTLEDKLNIRLLDKILFASGSATITSDGSRVLESLADELKMMQGFEISVAGHTDNLPLGPKIKMIYFDNLGLSGARAAAVARKLREMGVSPANLSATGYSMHHPVADNDVPAGRQQNRRVEIMLAPLR